MRDQSKPRYWKKRRKSSRTEDTWASSTSGEVEESWDVSQFQVPPTEGKTRFHDFDLPNPLLHAIHTTPYIHAIVEMRRDRRSATPRTLRAGNSS